jgi:ATP-dependent 26S proteasome regulatory subunit
LLVSGRIDRHIKVDLPTFEDRVEIIQIYLSKLLMKKQVDVVGFAIKTEGMNCSEVCESLRRAALIAVESGQSLTMADV